MNLILQPWHIVLLVLSAMIDGERDKSVDYLLIDGESDTLGKTRQTPYIAQ